MNEKHPSSLLTIRKITAMLALATLISGAPQVAAQSFVLSSSPAVGSGTRRVVAADVNGDDKLDLISANTCDSTLTVLTNNGDGTFTFSATLAVGLDPYSVMAADVNGDGKVDLISANSGDNTLTVLTNNGDGTFTYSDTLGVGNRPVSVVAADVNGDGNLDLISADVGSLDIGTLTVLTNNGDGTFTYSATLAVTAPSYAYSVAAADVNGDGKLDLISANAGINGAAPNNLTVLTNNGNGTFTLSTRFALGSGNRSVVAADVNGDGKLDLISLTGGTNTLTVLTNNGNGTFTISSTPGVGGAPSDSTTSLVAADVNGDGKVDLISTIYGRCPDFPGTLTVLLNSPAATLLNIQLTSTNTAILSWSAAVPGFALQRSSDLSTTNWLSATDSVNTVNGVNQVIISPTTGNNYFRLFHP